MQNTQSSSIVEHAVEVAELAREVIESVQRRDRDLASQLRRAISSISLNLAEGLGSCHGNARLRFSTALGSLREAQAGVRVAVAWRYVSAAQAEGTLRSLHLLGGRVFGLVKK